MADIFDPTVCAIGEGPLWHPLRKQLFWFDILGMRLHSREGAETLIWQFDEYVSAAGWIDETRLMIASETALFLFDIESSVRSEITALEANNPVTRSNDGRADPFWGFWISTMGKKAEPSAGSIYRWYQGELRKLFEGITVPNAICFAPGGRTAYFADKYSLVMQQQRLDPEGWPIDAPEPFIDLRAEKMKPDGAVVDTSGCVWNAQWGASRVAQYGPDGKFIAAMDLLATQISCPAFGGRELNTLFLTSAAVDAPQADKLAGQTFAVSTSAQGQAENQVKV